MALWPPRPSATKRETGINGNSGNSLTGAKAGGASSQPGTKTQGRKKAHQRASARQQVKRQTTVATKTGNIFGRRIRSGRSIESKHSNNNPLTYKDTIEILDSQYTLCDDISADGVKIHVDEKD